MLKILTIIGARPQFIKAAAISRAIKKHWSERMEEIILHTGQHYDANMSDVFFKELDIPKEDYNIKIGSGSHAAQTGSMMIKIENILIKERPDAVLLYGDTNSTLAGSLVASKLHIPVIHIEAGVRSYNKSYPEEVNRLICDHISSLLFVPTTAGINSLAAEGFDIKNNSEQQVSPSHPKVFMCGDIMYDNTLYFIHKIKYQQNNIFQKYKLPQNDFILATLHRPSNVDQYGTLESILKAFNHIIQTHGKSVFVPLHPRTKHTLGQYSELNPLLENDNLHIIPAVTFLDMIHLEKHADLIITDSGGVQKEAYFMEKPCLIMLEDTPWPELVNSGNAKLVGSDYNKICKGAADYLNIKKGLVFPPLYGNGEAAKYICEQILKFITQNHVNRNS